MKAPILAVLITLIKIFSSAPHWQAATFLISRELVGSKNKRRTKRSYFDPTTKMQYLFAKKEGGVCCGQCQARIHPVGGSSHLHVFEQSQPRFRVSPLPFPLLFLSSKCAEIWAWSFSFFSILASPQLCKRLQMAITKEERLPFYISIRFISDESWIHVWAFHN